MLQRIFQFIQSTKPPATVAEPEVIEIFGHAVPLLLQRHLRARRYILRLRADRTVVVTVPRLGTKKFAREFVISRKAWLEKQWRVLESRRASPQVIGAGTPVLFRGEWGTLQVEEIGRRRCLVLGSERIYLTAVEANLRAALESHLRRLAQRELPPRVLELAAQHGVTVVRVSVRNQRTRWGSCSQRGTISLNWRLIQAPAAVRDYVIVHELMHRRQMNHSGKFWAAVEAAFPGYRAAEKWLKENAGLLVAGEKVD